MSVKIEKILVLDDEAGVRKMLEEFFKLSGYQVVSASSIAEARTALAEQNFQLFLADLMMADGTSSIEFLGEVRKNVPKLPVIVFTGHGTQDTAIQAIRIGAFDYLLKPINLDEMRLALTHLQSVQQVMSDNAYFRQELAKTTGDGSVPWGQSPAIQQVLRTIHAVSPLEQTVLIQGESGTGKDAVARAIVAQSPRHERPLVVVTCQAVPEAKLEAQLFGAGGHLETAEGGTLLLNEVAEISPALQLRLLEFLQNRSFTRSSDGTVVKVDVRLLVSTSRNLKEETTRGLFRDDLYHLLSAFPVYVPPLRERDNDLFFIADTLLVSLQAKHGKKIKGFAPETVKKLREYGWPGNVRELQTALERALIMAAPNGELQTEDFALQGAPRDTLSLLSKGALPTIEEMERRLIALMLKQTGNNKTKAAKKLDISIRTMRNKLMKYKDQGFDPEDPDSLLRQP